MKGERCVYLAGPITGLSYADARQGWREDVAQCFGWNGNLTFLSPMRDTDDLAASHTLSCTYEGILSPRSTLARDTEDIKRADVVLVNFSGAARRSIGTLVEIGYAHALGKPIIIWDDASTDTHLHGWIIALATITVTTQTEAVEAVEFYTSTGL